MSPPLRMTQLQVVMMTCTVFASVALKDTTPASSTGLALAYLMQLTGARESQILSNSYVAPLFFSNWSKI